MTWRMHHMNVPAHDIEASSDFYEKVLGMTPSRPPFRSDYDPGRKIGWFETEGSAQLHLAKPDPNFAQRNGMHVNPTVNGHVAIEVDDLDAVKERLRERGLYFADPGNWALRDYRQIYFLDPSMNCVEVNQHL
jgi:catechol 2,3-dioxygenase-like lactoylglutathione lyase family enzyme